MKKFYKQCLIASVLCVGFLPSVQADVMYEVIVTNLTKGQILSPIFVVTHNREYQLFESGKPASEELAALAEDADSSGLTQFQLQNVQSIRQGDAPIMPGASSTVEIKAKNRRSLLSVAAMLVTTNDAFMALKQVRLPVRFRANPSYTVPAYDAGSENNDESCAYIPGPPCGNAFKKSDIEGEGFVHIHSGIHGGGDLIPATHDWNNPVAKISIRRIRNSQ